MSSIRKIKRRAMARLSEPVMQIKVGGELLARLNAMTEIQRAHLIRAACKAYIKNRGKELG